jgi:hypothetical protein
VCALAIRTGISPLEWERCGGRYIATAFDLLAAQDRPDPDPDTSGPQMSG